MGPFRCLLGFCVLSAFATTLQEAEQIALKKNLSILSAREQVKAERANRQAVLSSWLPQAFFTWNIKKYEYPSAIPGDQKGTYSGSFDISQTVFDLGLLRSYQRAGFDVKLSDLEVAHVSVDTLFAVRARFYSVVLARQLEAVRKRKVELLKEALSETQRRYKLGLATLFDVRQAGVFMANAEPPVRQAERTSRISHDRLAQLLGLEASKSLAIADQSVPLQSIGWLVTMQSLGRVPKCEYGRWEELALKMAPPVLIAGAGAERSRAKVRESQARYVPKVTGFFDVASSETGKWNEQVWEWSGGIALQVPIFEGLGRQKAVRRDKARARASEFDLEQAKLTQKVEVRSQLYAIDEEIANVASTEQGYQLAQLAASQAREKYRLGMIILLDYMSAVDNLFEAEVRYHTARHNLMIAYFALIRASGADLYQILLEKKHGS